MRFLLFLSLLLSFQVLAVVTNGNTVDTPRVINQCSDGSYRQTCLGVQPDVFLGVGATHPSAGSCSTITGTGTVQPLEFYVVENKGRYLKMSCTSPDITFRTVADGVEANTRYKAHRSGGDGACTFKLGSLPAHGDLYIVEDYRGAVKVTSTSIITNPDELYYIPDVDYTGIDSFDYCATDSIGETNTATHLLHVVDPASYPMPFGIPNPGFGLTESPPADPAEWPSAQAVGYYYVDGDDAFCTDSSNTYGYPDLPRCTIPFFSTIVSKLVLADSITDYTLSAGGGVRQITMGGTALNPAWFQGNDIGPVKPVITSHPTYATATQDFRFNGANYRISGVTFSGPRITQQAGAQDNVVVRFSVYADSYTGTAPGGTVMGTGGTGNNILHYQNLLANNGTLSVSVDGSGNYVVGAEHDIHAFTGIGQSNWWVLDNITTDNHGDGLQYSNGTNVDTAYIGRNLFDGNFENAVDLKDFAGNTIVSENYGWNYRSATWDNSTGQAQIFYVDDEGEQNGAIYFFKNIAWDTNGSGFTLANTNSGTNFACAMNNLAYFMPSATGFALQFPGTGVGYLHFNTAVNVGDGLYAYHNSGNKYITGNVVAGASNYQAYWRSSWTNITAIDYNFYTDSGGTFAVGGQPPTTTYSGLAAFVAASTFDDNSAEGVTPDFVNSSINDYRLGAASGFLNVIPPSVISTLFPCVGLMETNLSLSLEDLIGVSKPQGTNHDAGAYERE